MPPRYVPLEEQIVRVLLGGKLDEAVDSKLLQPGSVAIAENIRYNKHGEAEKEPGFTSSPAATPRANTNLAQFHMLDMCGDIPLISGYTQDTTDRNYLDEYYSQYYNSFLGGMIKTGYHVPLDQSTTATVSVEAPSAGPTPHDPDFAVHSGKAWCVWEDLANIYYCVVELATGALFYGSESTILRAGGGNIVKAPHIVALNNNLHVYWIEQNGANWDLRVADINASDPSSVAHSVRLATIHAGQLYDVCTYVDTTHGLSSLAVVKDVVAVAPRMLSRDDTNTNQRDTVIAGPIPLGAITIKHVVEYKGPTDYIAVAYGVVGNIEYALYQMDATTQVLGTTALVAIVGVPDQITLTEDPADNMETGGATSAMRVWWETAADEVRSCRAIIEAPWGLADVEDEIWPYYALQSRAFTHKNRAHVWLTYHSFDGTGVTFPSHEDTSVLVCSGEKDSATSCAFVTCGSIFYGKTIHRSTWQTLSSIHQEGTTDKYYWCVLTRESAALGVDDAQLYTIRVNEADFSRAGIKGTDPDETLLYPGGSVMCFDGVTQEHGFAHGPEIISLTPQNVGATFTDTDVYYYKAIYEWLDKRGLYHASVVSVPAEHTKVGNNLEMVVVVRGIIAGEYARDIKIAIFRQHLGTGTYHLVGVVNNPAPAAATVSFTDNLTETLLEDERSPYDHGGVITNWTTPPPGMMCKHHDRVWLISQEDPTQLWYSKPKEAGVSIEFCGEFYIQLDEAATAIVSNGDFLNVFTETRVLAIGGEGPNKLGQGQFWLPRVVSYDTGCTAPRSLASTDLGVFFQGARGKYILSTDGQLREIGDTVKDQWTSDVIRCQPEHGTQRLWFYLDDDSVLVYDYLHDRWSNQTTYKDATADTVKEAHSITGTMTHLSVNNLGNGYINTAWTAYTRLPTGIKPNDVSYSMVIGSPWITLGALTGFARTWFINLVGTWLSGHKMRFDIYIDYDDITPVQTKEQTTTSASAPYLMKLKPEFQKATAIKVKVSDNTLLTPFSSAKLTALEFVCGFKGGKMRRAVHSN